MTALLQARKTTPIPVPMLPQNLRESLIKDAIAPFSCTDDEFFNACKQFYQRNNLYSESELQDWLKRYGMSREQLGKKITRRVRLEKFKQATWGHQVEYYFNPRKRELDQVVYSYLETYEFNVAFELYLSLKKGEQRGHFFAELVRAFSQGLKSKSGGLIGPVELGTLSPSLAGLLRSSQSSQLWSPQPFGDGYIIVRLEKLIPAQLNESMRQRLLNELFDRWLQEQSQQITREFNSLAHS
jgi:parvulin-like peptidyl-prolyl isomerase